MTEEWKELTNCALCPNMCRFDCPVEAATGREVQSPAGKARLGYTLLQVEQVARAAEALGACTGCRRCTSHCPRGETAVLSELLRCVRGRLPATEATDTYVSHGNPYGFPQPAPQAGTGKIAYFPGCTLRVRRPEALAAAEAVFAALKLEPVTISDPVCCGYPAAVAGREELVAQAARAVQAALAKAGARTLVTGCPHCAHTLTAGYAQAGCRLDAEVTPFAVFIHDLIPSSPPAATTYACHDPCTLARGLNQGDAIGRLLSRMGLAAVRPPRRAGADTRCCGGGELFSLRSPDVAAAIAARRGAELKLGPTDVITACPFCHELLAAAMPGHRLWDIAEVVLAWMT